MNFKPLILSGVALFGVFGLYMASAKTDKESKAEVTVEQKIEQGLKLANLKSPDYASKPDGKRKKLLVFSRTNGFRHRSIGTGKKALKMMGEVSGAFDVVISDDLVNFDESNIQNFDAICFLNTTMNVFSPSKKELKGMTDLEKKTATEVELMRKANFMKFIADGKGFVGIHSATDTFYEWPEYGAMIGGYFDGHPWSSNMEVSVKADEKNKGHALLRGVIPDGKGELRFKEEIYQLKDPYDSDKVTMLLRLDPEASMKPKRGIKRKDNDFGVSWVKDHEKGRVFYSSLGHNHFMYWNKNVLRHYYAGIVYALGE